MSACNESAVAGWISLVFLLCVGIALLCYDTGHNHGIRLVQEEAIKHNAAEYDSVTGVWRWKQPAVENVK